MSCLNLNSPLPQSLPRLLASISRPRMRSLVPTNELLEVQCVWQFSGLNLLVELGFCFWEHFVEFLVGSYRMAETDRGSDGLEHVRAGLLDVILLDAHPCL